MQLTWKRNYEAYSDYRGLDFIGSPELIATDMYNAIDVSCWFWRRSGAVSQKYGANGDVNILIDNEPGNVRLVTLAVNGGSNGLHERMALFNMICRSWGLEQ